MKNAWAWAEKHGKLIKDTVHGAEMISVNVSSLRRSTNETGERMTQSGQTLLEDSTGSFLDPLQDQASATGSGGPPEAEVIPTTQL